MEGKEGAGEDEPSYLITTPSFPDPSVTGEGKQEQGGQGHPVGGDDQCRCITELDKDRSRGDRNDSDGEEDVEANHPE